MLKGYFIRQKWQIVIIIILKTLATVVRLFIPWAFAHLTENVLKFEFDSHIMVWGFYMISFAVFSFLINIAVFRLNAKFVVRLTNELREDTFTKASILECEQVDAIGISSIVSRLTTDIASVQLFSSKMMTKGIATLTTLGGSIFAASVLDTKLTVILLITIPLIIITIYFTTKIGLKRFLLTKKANDNLVKSIRENVVGIRVIRALSKFDYEESKFSDVNHEVKATNYNANVVNAIGSPTMKLFVNVGMVATLVVGAYYIGQGTSTIASLIAFMSYFTMILSSLVSIGDLFTMYSRAGAASNRIEEILKAQTVEYAEDVEATKATKCETVHHIEFKNVSFSYIKGQEVLKDISFKINTGDTLGILGVTGSGKTTIISLLLRLYQPDKGEIFIDGKSIRKYSSEKLYNMFGTVFQADTIFSESVLENISFGRDLNKSEIEFAAKTAQATNFISNLTEEFDTQINIRGQNISGGEKQRLLLSRALAGKPDILILDDSTTALDFKTDSFLRKELQTHFDKTTKIIISSRIASIMNAKQILVIDDGKISDLGTHEELIKRCSIYNKIRDLQFSNL